MLADSFFFLLGHQNFQVLLFLCVKTHLFVCISQQQNSESSERLLSDDVGAGFISGHNTQPATSSELNVDRSVDLPAQDEIGNLGVSKVIRADQKRFFFDLGNNNRGHFLRISEVCCLYVFIALLPLFCCSLGRRFSAVNSCYFIAGCRI